MQIGLKRWAPALVSRVCAIYTLIMSASAVHSEYLRPEDKLRFEVPGLHPGTSPISIEADGYVAFPYVGKVKAEGKTIEELNDEIGFSLVNKSATIIRPDGSPLRVPLAGLDYRLTVAQYAPIVVGGMVESPGQYAFRPGMTVQMAIAIAGGVEVPLSDQSVTATSLAQLNSAIGRALAERAAISVSLWRIDAFLGDADTDLPPPLVEGVSAIEFQELVEAEKQRLQNQHEERARLEDLLNERTSVLQTLSGSLQQQIASLKEEHDASEAEVQRVLALFERGLTPQVTVLEAKRRARLDFIEVSDAEQELSEAKLNALRLKEELSRFEQSQLRENLEERAQLLQDRIGNDAEIQALRSLARSLGVQLGDGLGKVIPKVTIYRDTEVLDAGQLSGTSPLMSGDFLQIELTTI